MKDKFSAKKPVRSMVLRLLLSFLCAMLFWVFVTSTEAEDYKQSFSGIPVVFEGESTMRGSRGLVITNRNTTSVRVTISGSRRVIANLDAADLTAVIDLRSITATGHYASAYKINFPSNVDSGSLTVTVSNPESVSFDVDRLSTKSVEVVGRFNGSAAEGFSAEPIVFEPSTVIISGPQNALEKVDYAYVEVSREDVNKTLSFESSYILCDEDGNEVNDDSIQLENETVMVTLPIISIKEVDLTLRILPGGGAPDANVKYDIEPKSIVLSGDSDALAGINNIDLATIDLSDIEDDTFNETYKIVIPNNTEILNGPKEAELTLEINGLQKKQFTVTNFSCVNVTEGYEAEVMVDNLTVNIRGTEDVLKNISDVNVRAVADLSAFGSATGIVSAPVRIEIDGTTEAGAVGDYEIYVNISAG